MAYTLSKEKSYQEYGRSCNIADICKQTLLQAPQVNGESNRGTRGTQAVTWEISGNTFQSKNGESNFGTSGFPSSHQQYSFRWSLPVRGYHEDDAWE